MVVACGIFVDPKSVPVAWAGVAARHGLGVHHKTLALAGLSFLTCPMGGGEWDRMSTDPSVWGGRGKTQPREPWAAPPLAPHQGECVFMSHWSPLQPERINPELNQKGYNVKSDVWSLGITMVLLGAGSSPCWSGGGQGGAGPSP